MHFGAKGLFVGLLGSVILLSGCLAKDVEFTEQQMRMQRCDQYIDKQRDDCLRGEAVTIEDYKEDLRSFDKKQNKEAEKALKKAIPADKATPAIEAEVKQENKA